MTKKMSEKIRKNTSYEGLRTKRFFEEKDLKKNTSGIFFNMETYLLKEKNTSAFR